jgi:protocatechuate 3,4-dioxygenase beta subunit
MSWRSVRRTSVVPGVALVLLALGVDLAARDPQGSPAQSEATAGGRAAATARAVVEGRVVEMNSPRPVPGATVQALGADETAETQTDAQGRYVLRLKPGSYTVAARAPGFVVGYFGQDSAAQTGFGAQVVARGGSTVTGIDVRLQSAGSISGRILDGKGRGLAGVEVELVRGSGLPGLSRPGAVGFALTAEDGSYRMTDVGPGDYYVRAYVGRGGPEAGGGVAYVSTFYPGVPVMAEGQPLRIYAGQELLDIEFALAVVRKFVVSGVLADPTGGPVAGLVVRLHSMGATGIDATTATADGRGRFSFRDIVSGSYFVSVSVPRGKGPPMPGGLWASVTRELVVDDDITDLELRAAALGRVSGRIVRDIGATASLDFSNTGVSFVRPQPGGGSFSIDGFGRGPVSENSLGEFEVAGGPVFVEVKAPSGWMVKAVLVDGGDVSEGPVDFGGGRHELEVILTDRISSVSGVVVDRNGRPLPNYSVVIFPREAHRWHRSTRFVQEARTDNSGQFVFDTAPPGVYLAVAVPALPRGALPILAPEMLEHLRGPGEEIRVGDGQRLSVAIRASPMPPGLTSGVP